MPSVDSLICSSVAVFLLSAFPILGEVAQQVGATPGDAYPKQECAQAGHNDRLWSDLLDLALEHTPSSLARVRAIAKAASYEPVVRLAELLLQEWDLKPTDENLKRPRLIFRPVLNFDQVRDKLPKKIVGEIINVRVKVGPDGFVHDFSFVRESRYEAINEEIYKALKQVRYRPARAQSNYISSDVYLQFIVQVD